jgi:hypothetical protein
MRTQTNITKKNRSKAKRDVILTWVVERGDGEAVSRHPLIFVEATMRNGA